MYDTAQRTQNTRFALQARIGRYWYMLTMCKTFSCCHPTKTGGIFTFSTRFTTSPPRCYHQFHSSSPVSDSTTIPPSSLLILFVNFFVKTPYYPLISTSQLTCTSPNKNKNKKYFSRITLQKTRLFKFSIQLSGLEALDFTYSYFI